MALIDADDLDRNELAYRVFGVTRDKTPWRAADIIADGPADPSWERAELAWRMSSRGYYAEQAGLVAAATLAAQTEDAPLRFSLALATADEARHADAFYQYAKLVGGGEPEPEAPELMEPLDTALTRLPYMGRALVHTMLEGFAADEFILLREVFAGDPLGLLYHHVRRDEIQHVAIGLNYLARESATGEGRELWREYGSQWHEIGMRLTYLDKISVSLADLTGREPDRLRHWFLRRHRARLSAGGVDMDGGR
ncbi:ferritin-like domain-containing protein [Solwaraspora sp. WMMD792]|uniref:ferritin-like domain-containing protein n=1 Tax=unclassified Solwaraspora TaxID=2627926 RepID=UPI002416D20A|nr:ferritin-like domain-containing protein [Solwaraspora sp. WMMD792]MDG4773663.1 ferritin-like domain-containing protein [Solwaraspora sp. WMMD792]